MLPAPSQAHGGVGAAVAAVEDAGVLPGEADQDGTTTFDGNQLPESCQIFGPKPSKNTKKMDGFQGPAWKTMVFWQLTQVNRWIIWKTIGFYP